MKGAVRLAMNTHTVMQPVTAESFDMIWTLIVRSVGLSAGLAVAMLIAASLLSVP